MTLEKITNNNLFRGLVLTIMLSSLSGCGEKKKQEQVNEKSYDTDRVQLMIKSNSNYDDDEIAYELAKNYNTDDGKIVEAASTWETVDYNKK